jgi:thioredoxin-dependent peroxiredoxin
MTAHPLTAGNRAPKFTLPNQDGESVSLAELRGTRVIVYFYPEAGTPACTTQACDFSANLGVLSAAGYTVLGISKDSVERLHEFAAIERVTFSLLSDPDLRVHRAYDAYGQKSLYGRPYVGTRRSTFVIDEKGVIQFAAYNVKAKGHAERMRKLLGA